MAIFSVSSINGRVVTGQCSRQDKTLKGSLPQEFGKHHRLIPVPLKGDISGQIIATSHDQKPKWWWKVREICLFQGNLGWWNIVIWPDILVPSILPTFEHLVFICSITNQQNLPGCIPIDEASFVNRYSLTPGVEATGDGGSGTSSHYQHDRVFGRQPLLLVGWGRVGFR